MGFHEVIILVYKNLDHGWSGRWLVDDLVRVHLSKFIPSFFIRENCPNELGPNHQPISDQINHGPSSYGPKLLLPVKPTRKNAFLSIWTRTIFEFISAMTLYQSKKDINRDTLTFPNSWIINLTSVIRLAGNFGSQCRTFNLNILERQSVWKCSDFKSVTLTAEISS